MANEYTFNLKHEPNLDAKLNAFTFQKEAVDFIAERDYAAIFHEQGLGKSKIAIDVILHWLAAKQIDTAVVFTKKGLIANWAREFAVHTHIRPTVLTEDGRRNYYAFTTPVRIMLAHFEVAKKEEKRFKIWLKTRRVAAVLDEATKIKNPNAALTQSFFRLSSYFAKRVVMTGTPAANRPYDVWAPIFFLDGGQALGADFEEFRQSADLTSNLRNDPEALAAFKERLVEIQGALEPISVRETKDGGRIVLPQKEYIRVSCAWEGQQQQLYDQVREELRATVWKDGELIEDDQEAVLKRLLRLIQIASNPALVDESYKVEPGKFPPLYDLVTDICQKDEKAIIFTTFNTNSIWLTKRLSAFGAIALNGKMPMEQRNQAVERFLKNKECRVLVATTGAAKEGLTLTVANHVIFFDRTYSLDDYLQAQDRIHRVSQVKTCFVYKMIMEDSIDEWIDALIEQKRLAAQLTQGDINEAQYTAEADFSFFDVLEGILNQ